MKDLLRLFPLKMIVWSHYWRGMLDYNGEGCWIIGDGMLDYWRGMLDYWRGMPDYWR